MRLVVAVWRRWVLAPLVLLAVVAVSLAVALPVLVWLVVVPLLVVVVVWRRWVLAVLVLLAVVAVSLAVVV